MGNFEYYTAEVKEVIKETKNVNRFLLKFSELDKYDFKAGQYAKVDMPIEDKKTYRQYSIASEPKGTNEIEFLIVKQEGGLGSGYLFEHAKPGVKLQVSKPLGRFVLPEVVERDICFICTGVGLAPFRAMYLDLINKNIPFRNIYLIFGTRYKEDLCYPEELYGLNEKVENFHYIPVLSREESSDWTGRKGYVHNVYKEIFADLRPAYFYLCGWDTMIKEARTTLMAMGYNKKDIMFEKYD